MKKPVEITVELPPSSVDGDPPYPFWRMAANLVLLIAIGNLSSFSVWSEKFLEYSQIPEIRCKKKDDVETCLWIAIYFVP